MGIELASPGEDKAEEFGDPSGLATETEHGGSAEVSKDNKSSSFLRARHAETAWVKKVELIAQLSTATEAFLELSDGITSHMVVYLGLTEGDDGYFVHY